MGWKSSSQDPKSVFGEALALADEAQRASYLDRVCVGDPDLRHEVESLLRAHEQANDFLRLPIPVQEFSLEGHGTVIGRYKLLLEHGARPDCKRANGLTALPSG